MLVTPDSRAKTTSTQTKGFLCPLSISEIKGSVIMNCKKCKMKIPDESIFCLHCGAKQTGDPPARRPKSRGNGQGCVYKLPSGKYKVEVVLGYYTDENGKRQKKRRTKVFDKKKDAIAAIPEMKSSPPKTSYKFIELYSVWSESHYKTIGKSKETAYKIAYDKCEELYWMDIADIRLIDMQKIVDSKGTSYYTKRDIKILLNQMWKFAMKNDYCDKNYAEYIKLPPLEKSKKDAFTDDEIKKLWKDYKAGNKFTGYILIMIYTGMRYGEISTILKSNVFLDEQYMVGGIKTEAGKNREIAISNKIKPIVADCLSATKKKLLEMNEDNFRKEFKDTLVRAGVRPLKPHSCRHTYATLLSKANIPPAIIKEAAGHKNYSTTLQYTHIKLDEKLKAVNKI